MSQDLLDQKKQSMHNEFSLSVPDWNAIDALSVTSAARKVSETRVCLITTNGDLYVELNSKGMRLRSAADRKYDYGLILNEPDAKPLSLTLDEGSCTISDGHLTLRIDYSPFSFKLVCEGITISQSPTDGHFVRRYRVPPIAKTKQGWVFGVDLKSNEAVYLSLIHI